MSEHRHVIVLGAGIIGLCSAYYCARRGYQVTVVDRQPAQRNGCSFGNAGMIVPSHFVPLAAPGMVALGLKWMANPASPFYIKPRFDADLLSWGLKFWQAANAAHVARVSPLLRDLNFASRAEYEALAAQFSDGFGLTPRGLLMLCRTAKALEEEAHYADRANALGVPAQVLSAAAAAALDPGITMDIAGAVFFPKDCHLSPGRFMQDLQRELDSLGVTWKWGTSIEGFTKAGTGLRSIRTSAGELAADEFVLASGAWSSGLADELGLKIPMQAGKGYSLTLPQPRQLPQLCSILTEARVAVTPMDGSLRFGGTMEIAGLNEAINPIRVQGIVQSIPKYFPEFRAADFANIQPWAGLRPCSPDGLPYLGRSLQCSNLTVATGHAMMGLSLGPITGKLVAELVSGEKPALDLAPLSPDRYR